MRNNQIIFTKILFEIDNRYIKFKSENKNMNTSETFKLPTKIVKLKIVDKDRDDVSEDSSDQSSNDISDQSLDQRSNDSSDEDSSDLIGDYYVEVSVFCKNDKDEKRSFPFVCNFGSEKKYYDMAEYGFVGLDSYFEDVVETNHPDWKYDGDWDEVEVWEDTLPENLFVIENI